MELSKPSILDCACFCFRFSSCYNICSRLFIHVSHINWCSSYGSDLLQTKVLLNLVKRDIHKVCTDGDVLVNG